jgi:amidase
MKSNAENIQAFMPYPEHAVPHAQHGSLHGLSFAVKDLFDVAGYPTSAGQPHMLALSGIKTKTAPMVQRLLDAGAKFVGKTVTDELAFSLNGQNAHFGSPVNGAEPNRISGGSSSGSASAVAHGVCDFAIGTDTGGSIRAPASHNGLYGLRPTHGRIDMTGSHALAPTFDVPGWFARDADVFARVAEVLFAEPVQKKNLSDKPIRLVMAKEFWDLLQPEVKAALQPAVELLQAAVNSKNLETHEVLNGPFDELTLAFRQAQGWEAWQVNGAFIKRYQPVLGPGVAQRFEWSSQVTAQQYEHAQSVRAKLKQQLTKGLGDNTVFVLPTMPDCAPLISQSEADLEAYRAASLKLLCVSGLTGLPQINLPIGNHQGVPLGLSLLGPENSDMWLVGLAQQVQASRKGGSS